MHNSIDPQRLARSRRVHPLALAIPVCAVLLAGCGGSSPGPTSSTTAAVVGATSSTSSTSTSPSGTSDSTPASAAGGSGLAFSRCMRADGVPNFPDPQPGGGLLFNAAGINPAAPAVRAAQAKCRKLLPAGGPPSPGSTTHPSAQTLAKLLRIAVCMHQHGISGFPEPRTSVPADAFASGTGVITDYDDAILLFPRTLNLQAPAYTRAVAACGSLAEKLARGPHG